VTARLSNLSSNVLAGVLAWPVARYIAREGRRLHAVSTPLTESDRRLFSPYFVAPYLDRVRTVTSDPLPLPNAPFHSQLVRLGLDFPSPRQTAAVTLDNVIASRHVMGPSLLFHELVHTVQFRLLGVHTFARLYVRGFVRAQSYHRIPLERCAFELGRRFERGDRSLNVESEVKAWIDKGLL